MSHIPYFSAAYLDPVTENNKEQIFDISILVSILELIRIIHIHVNIFFSIIPSEDRRQVVLMSCQGSTYSQLKQLNYIYIFFES